MTRGPLIAGAQRNVRLDLAAGALHVVRHAGHLENGLFVARGGDNVGVRLLLDVLDGGAFGTDDKADHAIGDAHLDGDLAGHVGRGAGWRSFAGEPPENGGFAGRTD